MKHIKRTKHGLVEKRTGRPIVSPLNPMVRPGITVSLLVKFDDAGRCVKSAAAGIDISPLGVTPSQKVAWVSVDLDGPTAFCAEVVTKLLDTFQPGVVIGAIGNVNADPAILRPIVS